MTGLPPDTTRWRREAVGLALLEARCQRDADRVASCGTRLALLGCDQNHAYPIWQHCDHRLCPRCAPRLSKRHRKTANRCVSRAAQLGLQAAHLVLTVPSVPDLGDQTLRDVLTRPLARLARRAVWKQNVAGAYRAVEASWNDKRSMWHPHMHLLVALKPPEERAAAPSGRWDFGEMVQAIVLAWHGLTGCRDDCEAKVASFGGRVDRQDDDHEKPPGCRTGGSVWMGDVYDLGAVDGQAGAREVAEEVAKYVSKNAVTWDGHPEDRRVHPRVGQLARAIHGMELTAGLGIFNRRLLGADEERDRSAACALCEAFNSMSPALKVDPSLRYRGPPDAVRRSGYEYEDPDDAALWDHFKVAFPADRFLWERLRSFATSSAA